MRLIRIYFLIKNENAEIDSQLFSDLDMFIQKFEHLISEKIVSGFVHVGFDRASNSEVLNLLNAKPNILFFTSAAKLILSKYFKGQFLAPEIFNQDPIYRNRPINTV